MWSLQKETVVSKNWSKRLKKYLRSGLFNTMQVSVLSAQYAQNSRDGKIWRSNLYILREGEGKERKKRKELSQVCRLM